MSTDRLSSGEDRARFDGFVRAALSARSIESIHGALSEIAIPAPYRVRTKVIYSQDDPFWAFDLMARRGQLERLSDTAPGYAFSIVQGTQQRRISGTFALLPTEHRSVRVIVSIATREQWEALLRLVRNAYPLVVPVLLSQKELITGVLDLREKEKGFELRVREFSGSEPIDNSPGSTRSIREWTDEALRDALAHIALRRQTIKSLKLGYYRIIGNVVNVTPSVEAKVTKRGEVEVTGRFPIAWDSIISYFARIGQKKLEFLSKRGLRERQYRAAPIEIAYGSNLLGDVTEVRRLVSVLRSYPHAMHAIPHGNPYAHVILTDIYDGSSFEVWSLSANSVVVVPKLKATEAAYERLIHHIFDRFQEGEVREFAA